MIAQTKPSSMSPSPQTAARQSNNEFLRYLPAVQTHANVQFRRLPHVDREEAVAEAVAAAYLNFASAKLRGKSHAIRPSMLATYAVRHVRAGRHVGGSQDRKWDVFSRRAQRAGGFKVRPLGWDNEEIFDCMSSPDQPVWRLVLLEDCRTPPPDQAAFRLDFSEFMAKQHDRMRTLLAMLASGHRSVEIADHLGITGSAVCQRRKKAAREWAAFQGQEPDEASVEISTRPVQTCRINSCSIARITPASPTMSPGRSE